MFRFGRLDLLDALVQPFDGFLQVFDAFLLVLMILVNIGLRGIDFRPFPFDQVPNCAALNGMAAGLQQEHQGEGNCGASGRHG